ncbi:MAG: hypothetical protein HC945_01160 [Nitrosarchaeum sp.]|nr:hypothetical protein [Nitrosarchaeum sp.]
MKGKGKEGYAVRGLRLPKGELARSVTLEGWPEVRGPDPEKDISVRSFVDAMATTGFQATQLHRATQIIRSMRREGATIFWGSRAI